MANPVAENLPSWQPDHASSDTNLPQPASAAGTGDAQDLAGNLRLLKSVIRAIAAQMSWERWLGIKNLANSATIAFTFATTATFTVNDNFSSSGRNIAIVGRRVRVTQTGAFIYGTITAASWSSPSTAITCAFDSGVLNAGISEVQFGPEPKAGLFMIPAGTAALPGLPVIGDPDTGVYQPAANTLGVALAGVLKTYWDTDGLHINLGGLFSLSLGAGGSPLLVARAHPGLDIGEIGMLSAHDLIFVSAGVHRGTLTAAGAWRFNDATSNAGGARYVQSTIPADADYDNGDITYVTA